MRSDLVYRTACLLEEMAKFSASEDVLVLSRRFYQNESQTLEVAKVDMTLGRIFFAMAKYTEAERCLDQSHQEYVPPSSLLLPSCFPPSSLLLPSSSPLSSLFALFPVLEVAKVDMTLGRIFFA
jgi:hypothetical protein